MHEVLCGSTKWQLAGKQLKQDYPQRINICTAIGCMSLPCGLLGRHIRGSANNLSFNGHRDFTRFAFSQSKVHYERLTECVHHDVSRLQITMYHSGVMGELDRFR